MLASTQTTTSTTPQDLTGLTFTPGANDVIEFEALVIVSSAAAASIARVTLNWASIGITDGMAYMEYTSSTATTSIFAWGNQAANVVMAGTSFAAANTNYGVRIHGTVKMSGTVTGPIKLQLHSEVGGAGNDATAKAGSFLKYRKLN